MNSQRTTLINDFWIVVVAIVMFSIILGVRKWGDQQYVAGYTEGYAQAEGYTRAPEQHSGLNEFTKRVAWRGNHAKPQ